MSEWIKCSERMPNEKEDGFVLTWREGEDRTSTACHLGSGEWLSPWGNTTVTSRAYLAPTHWKPLEDPPNGEPKCCGSCDELQSEDAYGNGWCPIACTDRRCDQRACVFHAPIL